MAPLPITLKEQEKMPLNNNLTLKNSGGLAFEFLGNGSVKSMKAHAIRINLKAATLFSKPGTNLYLRKRKQPFAFVSLLGPQGNSRFRMSGDAFIARGSWAELDYTCVLQLSKHSLSW